MHGNTQGIHNSIVGLEVTVLSAIQSPPIAFLPKQTKGEAGDTGRQARYRMVGGTTVVLPKIVFNCTSTPKWQRRFGTTQRAL